MLAVVVLSLLGTVLRFRGGSDSASATSLIGQLQSLKATVGEPKLPGLLQQNTALRENVEELERLLRHTLDGPDENGLSRLCLLYTSPSPRDQRGSRMPSSA